MHALAIFIHVSLCFLFLYLWILCWHAEYRQQPMMGPIYWSMWLAKVYCLWRKSLDYVSDMASYSSFTIEKNIKAALCSLSLETMKPENHYNHWISFIFLLIVSWECSCKARIISRQHSNDFYWEVSSGVVSGYISWKTPLNWFPKWWIGESKLPTVNKCDRDQDVKCIGFPWHFMHRFKNPIISTNKSEIPVNLNVSCFLVWIY